MLTNRSRLLSGSAPLAMAMGAPLHVMVSAPVAEPKVCVSEPATITFSEVNDPLSFEAKRNAG